MLRGPSKAYTAIAYGGRALVFVRMAADALENHRLETGPHEIFIAQYHAYAGISVAITAIDATATWLNEELDLRLKPGQNVSVGYHAFRRKVEVDGVNP